MDIKTCKICAKQVEKDNIETYPLMCNNLTFEPKANIVFCSKSCVKRFLISNMKKKTYLLTLYHFYLLKVFGITKLEAAPDPLLLACRQVHPTHDSMTKHQFYTFHQNIMDTKEVECADPKECAVCFLQYTVPSCTYVTRKEYGLFQFGNVGCCSRACVNFFLSENFDTSFREIYSDYRKTIHADFTDSFAWDPIHLIQHQIIPTQESMNFEAYHKNYKVPKPIFTEHYYSMEVLPVSKIQKEQTVEKDDNTIPPPLCPPENEMIR